MKQISLYSFIGLLGLLSLQSCKRDEPIEGKTLEGFFEENRVQDQIFTMNADSGSTFITSNYIYMGIDVSPFLNSNNDTVTGNVTIRLKEIMTKGDMILSGIFSVSGGKPLVSGGEFYIEATQNGEQLHLSRPDAIYLFIPITDSIPVNDYRGFYEPALTSNTDWGTPSDTISADFTIGGSSGSYTFGIDTLNWINCDYFYSFTGAATAVKANLTGMHTEANTKVFLTFNDYNSACMLYRETGSLYSPGSEYELPVGLNVTFVAISLINGQYYSAFQSTSISSGHIENLNLTPTTLDLFKIQVGNL
jgi:hypothetical protein